MNKNLFRTLESPELSRETIKFLRACAGSCVKHEHCGALNGGFTCTREEGHEGAHIAWGSMDICCVWTVVPPNTCPHCGYETSRL